MIWILLGILSDLPWSGIILVALAWFVIRSAVESGTRRGYRR
jgi:hypothetical protein